MTKERKVSRNIFYVILFLIGFAGIIYLSSATPNAPKEKTPFTQSFYNESEIVKKFPTVAVTTFLIALTSIILLSVACMEKISGRSPIPQFQRSEITWNALAVLKSIPVILIVYISVIFIVTIVSINTLSSTNRTITTLVIDGSWKICVCIWLFGMLQHEYKARLKNMGIRLKNTGKAAFYGFIGYVAILVLFITSAVLWNMLGERLHVEKEENPVMLFLFEEKSRFIILAIYIFTVVITPLVEEFYFRVVVFSGLRKSFGFWGGAIISAAFFSSVHPFYSMGPIFVLGLYLAYIFERTHNYAAPVFVHALHNGLVLSFSLLLYNN
ncbi:MAG: type II CAAX endopeptidase family protein [Planctomycetota bacterium]